MRYTGNLKDLRAKGLFLTVPRIPLPKMEVVSGVLFLPRPLDLNGTEFSHKDGEERQGGVPWLGAGCCSGHWRSKFKYACRKAAVQFFSPYTMKLL